ncbi:MAG: hypothetical protein JNK93_08805 [Planctomycetia bacterium]|nr:hypothetical protein [Planctomycetia bacterium]
MIFSSTLAVLTLSGLMGANLSVQPDWQTDYRKALALATKEHKPLAVFIVKGESKKLANLSTEVSKELKAHYIAVTINSADAEGKKLAQAFELTEGVVISDRTGEKQAYRIEGKTNADDLPQTLARLADPKHVTTTTEVHGAAAPVTAASFFAPSTYCPSCQQGRR